MKTRKKTAMLVLILMAISCGKDDAVAPPQNAAPKISAQTFSASEVASDTDVLGTVVASDEDEDDVLSFSITTNDNDLFEISTSGELSLASGKNLDFETTTSHNITVEVTDGEDEVSAIITINVVDVAENMAPVIANQSFTVAENIGDNDSIGDIIATDPDGDQLIFVITVDDDNLFEVRGDGTFINLKIGEGLDFETKTSHTFTVSVNDGILTTCADVTINVTNVNEAPIINSATTTFTVAEDIVSGTVVGNVTASDPEGDNVTFRLVPAETGGNKFRVGSDGTISLHPIHTLDYESSTSHTVKVMVTDGDLSTTQNITINVTDVVEPSGITVSTFAGSMLSGLVNGTGAAARFNTPTGLAMDASGNIYVGDGSNNVIRKITPAGVVSTFAGTGVRGYVDGPGNTAQFNDPFGLAIDAAGNIYVAEQGNHRIRKITPAGVVSTFAGSGTQGFVDGIATAAQFNRPVGLAIDASDNLIVAEFSNHAIRKVTPSGDVSTLAGDGTAGYADGAASQTRRLNAPVGVVVANNGTIYIADSGNNAIRALGTGGPLSTYLTSANGFNKPYNLTIDANDNMYITDWANHRIIRAFKDANNNDVLTTMVFSGMTGNPDFIDGQSEARFNRPWGIIVDNSDNLFVADYQNHSIRKITIE